MPSNVLALDVGEKRVGVAMVRHDVRVPIALETLNRQADGFWRLLADICQKNEIGKVVIGLPRGLNGQETEQTKQTQNFAKELTEHLNLPIIWQDEALTSAHATEILTSSGKDYKKSDVDAMAAILILGDYLETGDRR